MPPSPSSSSLRRRHGLRLRTLLATLVVTALAASLGWAQLSPASADSHPRSAAARVGSASAGQRASLAQAVCGTWVLYQVSSARSLKALRPKIEDALSLPGVVGLSVRFPWNAADIRGHHRSHPILRVAHKIAKSQGKALSVRFLAGSSTPARVFRAGASYYKVGGHKVPLPFDNATGRHAVFLKAYNRYVRKLAAWSRRHRVRLLHLSQYGQAWAELNNGAELRAAPGYTERKWLKGHRQLIEIAARYSSSRLAVELPLSGYGPLSEGQSAALANKVIRTVGKNSPRFFIQANGWDESRDWGSPTRLVERHFDRIWRKPVMRGLQMIQPDGYRWDRVFDQLDKSHATYAEVYLPSFWQVPGPTRELDHNTSARINQLERQIRGFRNRTC
jgi:hypothetical protein